MRRNPSADVSEIFLLSHVCVCSKHSNFIFEGIYNALVRMPINLAHKNKLRTREKTSTTM